MKSRFSDIASSIFRPRPKVTVAEWCCQNLTFDEAGNHSQFNVTGSEYTIEPLNDFARLDVNDECNVWGSQTRKTGVIMGGVAWCLEWDPCGFLWVMPNIELARAFSRQRWRRMIRRSAALRHVIPEGGNRHSFSVLHQELGRSTINFVGSNASTGLSSSPARRVILDEVEKFHENPDSEADAVNLAEQRTKGQFSPQRWKSSTPADPDGLIWREFLKGDQRRYFVPCPLCGAHVVLVWSRQYTVFQLTGNEAFISWDGEAKGDGEWDLGRVEETAHATCPHCKQSIPESEKSRMVANGKWVPTSKGAPGFVSRHLPSLYSSSQDCRWGKLAVKFLQAKSSPEGVQGFVNGDLAEPYAAQESISLRNPTMTQRIEITDEWVPAMTVDCQATDPAHWVVVRKWSRGQGSAAIDACSCANWDEVEAKQKQHKVPDQRVLVDSGWGAKTESEVYRRCGDHCDLWIVKGKIEMLGGLKGIIGWTPTKGLPGRRRWADKGSKASVPHFARSIDPFIGTTRAGKYATELIEFSSDTYSDMLETLAANQSKYRWVVQGDADNETYWHHWNSEVKAWVINRRTNKGFFTWRKRTNRWPNHLRDAEKMQVVGGVLWNYLELPK